MVQQKRELSLGGGGKDTQSQALGSHWLEHRTPLADSNSLWMRVLRSVAGGRSYLRMARTLPHPVAFWVLGSIESSQLSAGFQGI